MESNDHGTVRGFFSAPIRERHVGYTRPGSDRAQRIIKILDAGGFSKRLFFVGASGFLASSYTFFVTHVIKPELYYVYPPCGRLSSNAGLVIDELTLVGAALGMLVAGHLADLWGRKKLYGFELAILIIGTLGVTQASVGFQTQRPDGTTDDTMDIYSWLSWWRFVTGCAIGAEYPLVAVITAEWSPTKSRGRMLASVFAMAPVARLLTYAMGFSALNFTSSRHGMSPSEVDEDLTKKVIDQVWRWASGFAIVPAAAAVIFRLTIPETPRYYAFILRDLAKALRKAKAVYGDDTANGATPDIGCLDQNDNGHGSSTDSGSDSDSDSTNLREWYTGAFNYLRMTRAGKDLAVISGLWTLMEICWYCVSLDSPSAMLSFWAGPAPSTPPSPADPKHLAESLCPEFNAWRTDPGNPNTPVYRELEGKFIRFLLVVSIGSTLGSISLIFLINRYHRKQMLMMTCCMLAALFTVSGGIILGTQQQAGQKWSAAVDVLFGMMHFFLSIGPKTLILIIAAEVFPTVYRGTFYGVAGAVGKVGGIAIRPIIGRTAKLNMGLGIRLLVAVVLMAICAKLTCLLPKTQSAQPRTPDVEMPAGGGADAERDETVTITEKGIRRILLWAHPLMFQKLETRKLEDISQDPRILLREAERSRGEEHEMGGFVV